MRVVCLNGSPKGERSVTVQGARFLARRLSGHELTVLHVGQRIHRLEREPAAFGAVLDEIGRVDAVIWFFPVYLNLVPSQLKRFVELLVARGGGAMLRGKYATAISTSVHFYDDLGLGFATDDHAAEAETTASIVELAREIDRRADLAWRRPATFLGVAGHKIFRDLVYGNRAVMRADHRHYRRHGLYDFPTGVRQRLRSAALSLALRIPGAGRRSVFDRMLDRTRAAGESAP